MARGIDRLVEEQIRRWRLQEKERAARRTPPKPEPVICVSREFGSLGAAIGRAAADQLSFSFWDQELVQAIAERTGASQRLVATLDEHARSELEDLITGSLLGSEGTEYEYVRQLRRVVHTIAQHGRAVIIGRGAHLILGPHTALRVRIIEPYEQRLAGYAAREGLSSQAAAAKLEAVENDRRAFIRRIYGEDIADPTLYDLMLNRATFDDQGAAAVIAASYRAKFPR